MTEFRTAAEKVLADAVHLVEGATARAVTGAPDNTADLLDAVGRLMSTKAGPVRSSGSIREALTQVHEWLAAYPELITADGGSRRAVDRVFLVRDILTTAYVYLSAMADYVAHGGRSHGSVLCTDADGRLPQVGYGADAAEELDLPELFRFRLDGGALDGEVQEAAWSPPCDDGTTAGGTRFTWRSVRPFPADDGFFENVWREFREHGTVG